MPRVLVTGMSGTGKSAVAAELAARGLRAVDLDTPAWSEWVELADDATPGTSVEPGRDWAWRADRVASLLADDGDLFATGCAANMGQFLGSFGRVVLLRAPVALIRARLAARPDGEYGARPDEAARVLALIDEVEPLLRRVATDELDSSGPVAATTDALLDLLC